MATVHPSENPIRVNIVTLKDGRTVYLFVNRDTNLIVLDIIDANERDGVEVYRHVAAPTEPVVSFFLVDDGTMDTVIRCSGCGKEERFNPEPPTSILDDDEEWDRVGDAMAMMQEDHECDSDEEEEDYEDDGGADNDRDY